ncbi:MAG: sigma-54 dependent transcriptional regulator [Phycisphaerae bacterium]|nr:sigma-54-dependent Fis family transcriptional regulator [Phycisphaerae bacterium]MCZ2400978.1 sigma-54 dependent transcriptional regulator [Phycisphaerae bacterium]NUQ48615.1 sigma-54-dependent Fis family transcriptional regulator [Phycisphaerae bacterium]
MSIRVLIVEDEALIRWSLRQKFEERGYRVTEAETGRAALEALDAGLFDFIMLDYKLPDMTGLDVLRKLRESDTDTVVIMMTAFSSIESAVEAIKLSAYDYLPKPFEMERLLLVVDKALETTKLRREVRELRQNLKGEFGTDTIIGSDHSMTRIMEVVDQVARTGVSTVLLRGETGTGKDLVARVIHQKSDRAGRPFVNITCTALSETLLESELFGHERGAFTDAKAQKKGLLEVADGGTVFLDEIGDMPAALQAKLLRFLEERKFRRVGGTRELTVDVRVIAATNRDIEQAINEGRFRRDLLYRLNVVTILLPPLRARGDDLRLLAQAFVQRFTREFKKNITAISPRALEKLYSYPWPGNVRELRNVLERAALLCTGTELGPNDILLGQAQHATWDWDFEHVTLPPQGFDFRKLGRLERNLLTQALERTGGNQSHAARLLHLTRDRLRYRLQKHGLL